MEALWVVTWALVLTYLTLSFAFSLVFRQGNNLHVYLIEHIFWLTFLLFLADILLVLLVLPLFNWFIPKVEKTIFGHSLAHTKPITYLVFSFDFLPVALFSLIGIPILINVLSIDGAAKSFEIWAVQGQRITYILFPIILFVSSGIAFLKGSAMLRRSEAIHFSQSMKFFVYMTLAHLFSAYFNVGLLLVIFEFITTVL